VNAAERLGLGTAFARSLLATWVDGPPRPISASFAVTNRCNLRCSYCNTPFLDPNHLGLDNVALLFDRLVSLGVKRLGLAGGEPLARKDIGELIGLAKTRGLYVTLNSNLTLYARRKDAVQEVDLFFTSLDGDRAAHESARGVGSYDGVLEAIDDIIAGGRTVVAICVVSQHSLDQARGLLDEAERRGFQVHFQPQCVDTEIVRGSLADELTNDRLRAFWAELLREKNAGRPVGSSTIYLRALSEWDDFSRSSVLEPDTQCAAWRGFFYVDPHGNAYPCAFTKGKTAPVDMLADDWRERLGGPTPCTRCSVGPYLEFNLLYSAPVRATMSLIQTYA